MIGQLVMDVNWTNVSADWISYSISGYDYIFGNWVYPLIFLGIIGYVYCINRSAISAAVAICIIFAVFGGTAIFQYPDIAEFSLLGWLIVIFSFAGLFTLLFTKKGRMS
jgi:hypothetical protein